MSSLKLFNRRRDRTRYKLRKMKTNRPRLSVFRSNKYIYAQVIDDLNGKTVASASSREDSVVAGATQEAAAEVGKLVAGLVAVGGSLVAFGVAVNAVASAVGGLSAAMKLAASRCPANSSPRKPM